MDKIPWRRIPLWSLHCYWKQVDDLPIFTRIVDIFVIVEYPLVEVKVCRTAGLSNHLMSYQLETTLQSFGVALSTLAEHHSYTAHTFDDGKLYITIRSHVKVTLLKTI